MRVAVVYLGRRGPGGPISLELARHLSTRTETFAVVSVQADHYALWQESGIDLVSVPTFATDYRAAVSLLSRRRMRSLSVSISEKKPDVVVYPMVHPWTPFLQRHLRHIPHVITVHDVVPHPGLKHLASSVWETMAARQASRCVVMSPRFVADLSAKGVPAERIDVIPHGIFSFYGRNKASVTVHHDGPASILFFGRITAYKGLEVLLQAFELVSAHRKNLRLEIVGAGDLRPYSGLLDRILNVRVVNRWVDDAEVAGFFERADFVVLPYTTASQSGVVPLAASFRVPVIATKVGALPDQIRSGETGLLINANSVEELAEAMDFLLDRPQLAAAMGVRLADQTMETGNWDRIAEAFLDSCRRACSPGG
jgi:glycosyltransferase involved in cell wall biosynthesis